MSVYRVASAYAKSLISLASEKKKLDDVLNDMQFVLNVYTESKEFKSVLNSPVIPSHKKLSIIEAVFAKKVSEMSLKFFVLISKKGREQLIGAIASSFIHEYKQLKGIQLATVVTAVEIDDKIKKNIGSLMSSITENKVELAYKVDSSLIGGYILNTGDKQFDASVKSKLNTIKKQFNSNPYISKY